MLVPENERREKILPTIIKFCKVRFAVNFIQHSVENAQLILRQIRLNITSENTDGWQRLKNKNMRLENDQKGFPYGTSHSVRQGQLMSLC